MNNGRLRSANTLDCRPLSDHWELCCTDANSIVTPDALRLATLEWLPTTVPSTAASSLQTLGRWSLESPPHRFDSKDWWYRSHFNVDPADIQQTVTLHFAGLATVASIWLNGKPLSNSENMFRELSCDVTEELREQNELLICFHSLDALLAIKRPRPRWKAPMIEHQQLRWFRTTLLGRTPGWSPSAAAVGPWREITLRRESHLHIDVTLLNATLANEIGVCTLACTLTPIDGSNITRAELCLHRGDQKYTSTLAPTHSNNFFESRIEVPHPDLWWPHTHGDPALYQAMLNIVITTRDGATQKIRVNLGSIGFRTVALDTTNSNFAVFVNGVQIFCRGACWTPLDVVSMRSDTAALTKTFDLIHDAGMNMLRVGGTMAYESDEFLDLCDARGILLWQDLMFANMDYPEDAEFVANLAVELKQQLSRLNARPCLTVICGNSEGEQQAAMFGATRDRWSPKLFHETIPAWVREHCGAIPYWPSSAHGGVFPHQNNAGTTSYYGVGAYLRPLEDARRSEVKFATECLAFANVPDDACIARMPTGLALKVHHSRWKERTPRDLGAGWDFEDVRDFYLRLLFELDPIELRYADHDRYLELSRVVTGEVIAATMSEWRRAKSSCNGALIWFLKDLWRGAGWGILDADGHPKSVYFYLRRTLQPLSISISDEGCNGLCIHVVNDSPSPFTGRLCIDAYRQSATVMANTSMPLQLAPHSSREIFALELVGYFSDLNHAYRFGPAMCDVVTATLRDANNSQVGHQTFFFPQGHSFERSTDIGLRAKAKTLADGDVELELSTTLFAQSIVIAVDGYVADDQFFHLPPTATRSVRLTRVNTSRSIAGTVKALNCNRAARIETL